MRNNKLCIVTQDPANFGGVLRLVQYVYARALAVGLDPTIVHYGKFAAHPEINASVANIPRGELKFSPDIKHYQFRGMHAIAIGARFPEWEPNRIKANSQWKSTLEEFDRFILVTGSAHTGLPIAQCRKPFAAWISSTVYDDRRERLRHPESIAEKLEKRSLPRIVQAEQRVLADAKRLFAVSHDASAHLKQFTDQNIEVLPYPVDTSVFKPDSAKSRVPRFVFVGRANDPRKRIDLFIAACEMLRQRNAVPQFEALVVSGEQAKQSLTPIQYRSGLSDQELVDLYQTALAFVLTSEQEGLGIAAMEAMACGLPVISTRCGGPESFIQDNLNGCFVTSDPNDIADSMHHMLTDRNRTTRLSTSATQTIASDFSRAKWDSVFDQILQNL